MKIPAFLTLFFDITMWPWPFGLVKTIYVQRTIIVVRKDFCSIYNIFIVAAWLRLQSTGRVT